MRNQVVSKSLTRPGVDTALFVKRSAQWLSLLENRSAADKRLKRLILLYRTKFLKYFVRYFDKGHA